MLRKKRGSLEWLEFELLQEFSEVRHAVFLRYGGVSEGPYSSLNVGGSTGDDESWINLNRAKIRKHLDCKTLVSGRQVHGIQISLVPLDPENEECDGLITKEKAAGLFIRHADCQAIIFYDPVEKTLGCIHAGWRGNVQNIYAEAIGKMHHLFGSKPQNLFVGISPSLGPCCSQFIHYEKEIPRQFWTFQTRPLYFDLWEMARFQLFEAGILPHHLEIAPICTCCNPADFYSYRRDKTTGRNATVVCLKDHK
jgi:YfiH family protein